MKTICVPRSIFHRAVGFASFLALMAFTSLGAETVATAPAQDEGVDHAGIMRAWNPASLARGEKLYHGICVTCHGTPEKAGTLPTSRPFWKEPFKNGNDPYSVYKTIGTGLGQMPAWPWLSAEMRYDVIQYIRETFVKPHNPGGYFAVTPEYLNDLPKGSGKPVRKSAELIDFEKGPKYLRMDFGPMLMWTYQVDTNNIAYKGIAVRLDEGPGGVSKGRAWLLYDHDTMRVAAGWSGDQFVNWKGIAFDGTHQTHTSIMGDKAFINPIGPGWANPQNGSFEDPRFKGTDGKPYGPLPREWTHFRGVYLSGEKVVISYTVGDAEILELPGQDQSGSVLAFSRNLNVGKSSKDLCLRLAPENAPVVIVGESAAKLTRENGFNLLRIPAQATPLKVKVLIGHSAPAPDASPLTVLALLTSPAADLRPLLYGGARRWPVEVVTKGKLGDEGGPFAVDAVTMPASDKNPWQSWMRLGGFDFFKEGRRAAVCTWLGDVWLVDGVDGKMKELKWRRIVTGLFQPLGVKIVDETVYICCRDQIVRLHDLNGDGEMDFYECFNNDHQVTEHFHEFAMGLQTDREGNFYYAKSARHALPAVVPHHGTLLKVSKDGSKTEIVASGFRAANGVCVNDDGTFFVTDQEGHWTPKNRIDWVRPGKFYGNMFAYDHPASNADDAMEPSMVWITNDMDRSPGEVIRVTSDRWGPFKGALLNLSYGTGRIFLVPNEMVNGQLQAGVIQLPIPDFPTGVMRGRFNPANGQLYACGLYAWAGNQHKDGGFYRIRYMDRPAYLPLELHTQPKGLRLTFTDALDAAAAADPNNYAVKTWSLKRTADYGSKHYDEQPLKIVDAALSADGKTVVLNLADLKPTMGMEIKYTLRGKDGKPVKGTLHNTINALNNANPPRN